MTFAQSAEKVPANITGDPVWKLKAYQLGLFICDLAWPDATKLLKDRRTTRIADQLFRAASNISSNICEGFSRGTGKDRARFYEYALGSARETRDWYFKSRHVLGETVYIHRLNIATELVALLVTMVRTERRRLRLDEKSTD